MKAYHKKGDGWQPYEIVTDNAKMRHPDTGEWIDCVIYVPLYPNDTEMFARDKKSFEEKFISEKEYEAIRTQQQGKISS